MSLPIEPPSGDYPIDASNQAELERLERQDEAWAPHTAQLLDQIGVRSGMCCLDLGCGPRGATRVLSERVGDSGRVVGLEYNPEFLRIARHNAPSNVEIVEGDAYATGMNDTQFDLVHMRFLASTAGQPEQLLAEAIRLIKPGGYLAMQEANGKTLACFPPNDAWSRLHAGLRTLFPEVDGDYPTAHRLYQMLHALALEDIGYQPAIIGVRSGDPWQDYFPATMHSLRNVLIERKLMTAADLDRDIAECRSHLEDPATVFVSPMLVQVWGRKPT